MRRWEWAMLIGLIIAILLDGVTAFAGECTEIRQETLRLHILANSDSPEDQELKLQVRDALLAQWGELFTQPKTRQEARDLAKELLPQMEETAREVIREKGYQYPVRAYLTRMDFTTRTYPGFALPAGEYEAIRVEIGSAQGQNWWCVMFPPMCVPAAQSRQESPLEKEILSLGTPAYEPRFALVEWWESLKK